MTEHLWIQQGRTQDGKPMLFQEPARNGMRIFVLRHVTVMANSLTAAKKIQTSYRNQPRIDN